MGKIKEGKGTTIGNAGEYLVVGELLKRGVVAVPAPRNNPGFDVVDKETGQRIKRFDCEDYAIRLQEKALRDGYIISFEVIRSVEYNGLFKQKRIPNGAIHAINSVILGNEVYYIEPQTGEIAFVAYLD